MLNALETDIEVVLECEITIDSEIKKHEVMLIIKGKINEMTVISEWITMYFATIDINHLSLPTTHPNYNCLITWESSNAEILSVSGVLNKPYGQDVTIQLSCEINYQNEIKNVSFDVVVMKVDAGEEITEVSNWLIANYANKVVDQDMVLPSEHPTIPATLTWLSFYEDIMDDNGHYVAPILDQKIEFLCTISFNGEKEDVFVEMVAKGSGTVMESKNG